MTPDQIRAEVQRLATADAGDWCPDGGWQFPFDFGHGIVAPTYAPIQAELHPWRQDVMLAELDRIYAGRYADLSVLDLGACEGAMALALWRRGVRDITCVEVRPNNVAKARFVFERFDADIAVIESDVEAHLARDTRTYDLVLFMGLLYHLIDPFVIFKRIGALCRDTMLIETVLARPATLTFSNDPGYSPTRAAFFVRQDSVVNPTAGTIDLELWPTPEAFIVLLRHGGFPRFTKADYGSSPPRYYDTDERVLGVARKA